MKLDRKNYQALFDLMDTWSGGDKKLKNTLTQITSNFIIRYGLYTMEQPTEDVSKMCRIFKGMYIMDNKGMIKSSENFIMRNPFRFFTTEEEKVNNIACASWDNKASLFTEENCVKSIFTPSFLNPEKMIEDYVRLFEYPLNSALQGDPLADLILLPAPNEIAIRKMVPDMEKEFKTIWGDILKSQYMQCIEDIKKSMVTPPIMSLIGRNSIEDHNWLTGKNPTRTDECKNPNVDIGTARRQIVEAYPILYLLIKSPVYDFNKKVDNLQPIIKDVADYYKTSENNIKNMQGLTPKATNRKYDLDPVNLENIIKMVSFLPKGKKPQNNSEWMNFFSLMDIGDFFAKTEECPEDRKENYLHTFMGNFSNRWDAYDASQLSTLSHEVKDIFREINSIFLTPICESMDIKWNDDTFHDFIFSENTASMVDRLLWWQQNRIDLIADISTYINRDIDSTLKWEPLTDGKLDYRTKPPENNYNYTLSNGLIATPLITAGMLQEEGKIMKHCVGGYVPDCMYKGTHIISIRTRTGESLGTMEIMQNILLQNINQNKSELIFKGVQKLPDSVVQFRGVKNSVPCKEAFDAMCEYIDKIVTEVIPVTPERLITGLQKRNEKKVEHNQKINECNNKKMTLEEIRYIWNKCEKFLPKKLFKKGPVALIPETKTNKTRKMTNM